MIRNGALDVVNLKVEVRNAVDSIVSQLRKSEVVIDQKMVAELEKFGLPICSAHPLPFDHKNKDHRKGNQIGLGFPFTNENYKWPIDSNGEPKQPIVQLDLRQASRLLGYDLGDDLIQLWVCADVLETDPELELVRIDSMNLSLEPDPQFPRSSIWVEEPIEERSEADKHKTWHWDTSRCRFNSGEGSSPLVEWTYRGIHFPNALSTFKDLKEISILYDNRTLLKYIDEIQDGLQEYFLFGLGDQLGGYTYDWGRNDIYSHPIDSPDCISLDSNKSLLLYSSQWDNGLGTSGVYIKAQTLESGVIEFECDIYERFER